MTAPRRAEYLSGQTVPVNSSWVRAVTWTAPDSLAVYTAAGEELLYAGCPPELFDELLAADSKGTFINQRIKPACRHLNPKGKT